jgi:putative ABC transport system substrate-binding protein
MGRQRRFVLAWVAALATPPAVLATRPARRRQVGCLWLAVGDDRNWPAIAEAFARLGLVEGRNLAFHHRHGRGNLDSLQPLAAELVSRRVDLILATSTPSAMAAKRATARIPIVFAVAGDPIAYGLVSSLARPGGNLTGVSLMVSSLGAKRMELLAQAVPVLDRVGVVWNPAGTKPEVEFAEVSAAARRLNIAVHSLPVSAPVEFASQIAAGKSAGCKGVVACAHPSIVLGLRRLADACLEQKMPAIFWSAAFAQAGGLMAYGPRSPDTPSRLAAIAAKVLAGAKPADLPVEQPLRYDLVVNRKTARTVGLTLPHTLLLQATEVIDA